MRPAPAVTSRTRTGTLIPNQGAPDGGRALTADHARQSGQPCRVVALAAGIDPAAFRGGLAETGIRVLNFPVWASLPQRSGIYGEPRAKTRPIILAYPMKGPRFGFTVVHAVDPTAGRAVGSTLGSRALHLDPRHRRSALERTPT